MKKKTMSFLLLLISLSLTAQTDSIHKPLSFFDQAPTFNPTRCWLLTGIGASAYTGVVIGLDRAWYANYARGSFHFFDDWSGWRQMDKLGHSMTTYFESKWIFDMYKWSGVERKKAAWIGFGSGMLFQTTIEVLDGFSNKWGFSWHDITFNLLGAGLFIGQEYAFSEQRFILKMSTHRPSYSDAPLMAINTNQYTTLANRATDLFGSSFPELFFKEYNGQTIWLSANISSFINKAHNFPPKWLNIAVGYGVENMYGAESNEWADSEGNQFIAPPEYQPYSQFYLSLDIDFDRIPTKHKWLKTIFSFLNVFKVPFPTLEINTLGQFRFHPLYF